MLPRFDLLVKWFKKELKISALVSSACFDGANDDLPATESKVFARAGIRPFFVRSDPFNFVRVASFIAKVG